MNNTRVGHTGFCASFTVVVLAELFAPAAGAEPIMNPRQRLEIKETRILWTAGDASNNVTATQARFSPDGRHLAWRLGNGAVMIHTLADGHTRTAWSAKQHGGHIADLVWSPCNRLAACRRAKKETPNRNALWVMEPDGTGRVLDGIDGAERLAWRADGRALAFSTQAALFLHDFDTGRTTKLLDPSEAWRPRGSPAYENMIFVGMSVAARTAGSAAWTLAHPDGRALDLGACRGLAPDPARQRLYIVPWLAGPTKIPRGAGIVRLDLSRDPPTRETIVPYATDAPYWLVDIWDWEYPSALRVAPDGQTLTFVGVQAGVLASNAWRECRLWQVPSDGSLPPEPKADMGLIFKRFDVGAAYGIGWRYNIESAVVLVDFESQRAWKLPNDLDVQRANTDMLIARRLIGAARGNDVVLIQLESDPAPQ